jgi:uncharacterized protein YcaQ
MGIAHATDLPVEHLDRREARALAVIAQGLAYRPSRRKVRLHDLERMVSQLGCVQLDTISVISRSHETVAFSRLGPYDTALWEQLYEPHHAITEYWAHAAAIIPMENLHLFRPHMKRVRVRLAEVDSDQEVVRTAVLERIRNEGPLASRHFEAPKGSSTAAWDWYGRKPEREALADLWSEGRLILRRRENFQRIFDVPEQLAPDLWTREIDEDERLMALALKAMSALGVTTVSWLADYFRTGGQPYLPRPAALRMLDRMVKEADAIPVTIEGVEGPAWMSRELVPVLDNLRNRRGWPTRTALLSPFDNLIWYRPRGEQLWNFHYRLECYTPAAKRVYGYYSLPILHRGRLVGRLDPSFNRKKQLLTIKSFHWEPKIRPNEAMKRAVGKAIGELCQFLGTEPDRWVFASDVTDRLPKAPEEEPHLTSR